MKKIAPVVLGLFLMTIGIVQSAETKKPAYEKFYGKVTSVDLAKNTLNVTNKSKKLNASFEITNETKVVLKKKAVPQTEIAVGRNLIVYFVEENNKKVAKKITVRASPKKES